MKVCKISKKVKKKNLTFSVIRALINLPVLVKPFTTLDITKENHKFCQLFQKMVDEKKNGKQVDLKKIKMKIESDLESEL